MDVAMTKAQQYADEEQKASNSINVQVGDASTGAVHAVTLNSTHVAIEELREVLERLSGVPVADQILLGGPPFARLDPRRTIEYYGLPAKNKEVFLYDRRLLSQDAAMSIPTSAALAPIHADLPSQPMASSEGSKMLSESSHPMMRALAEYEGYFQLQVSQSEALGSCTRANITASEQSTHELQVQEGAVAAAIANLDLFKNSMMKHFAPFWDDFQATIDKHERLLSRFDSYLEALATVKLHPALQQDERKTLHDCVPVDKEREWAVQCEKSHTHVRAQVMKLRQVHDEICNEVTDMLAAHANTCGELDEASMELEQMKVLEDKQMVITNTLRDNLRYVLNSLEETSSIASGSNPLQASTNALDVCRRIDALYQSQQNMVPNAQHLVNEVVARVNKIASKKAATYSRVLSTLRKISISQSKIRDFENSLTVFREALAAQKKYFNELEHLEKLPESYAACLKEISRRLKYGHVFSDRIQSMAEELAQLREDEVQHREIFLRSYGQHLPRDFVAGLAEKPSHCEFRMRPFDQSLPVIEDEQKPDSYGDKERSLSDEFVDCEDPSSESNKIAENLQERCKELEARVLELTTKLEQANKHSYFDGSGSESIARSDISKTSAREYGSSCEFPLVMALAETASGMTSVSEVNRSNPLDQELATVRRNIDNEKKDALIAKLEIENQQFLLNAAAFEEYPFYHFIFACCVAFYLLTERSKHEKQLKENQSMLQQTLTELESTARSQRNLLARVLRLLQLPVEPQSLENEHIDAYLETNFDVIEKRVEELLTSAESEASELSKRRSDLSLVESELDTKDSFKISFRSFSVNDLALFLPTSAPGSEAQRVYLAFHLGCPHRFLSEESISSFSHDGQRYPDYVVGRIVLIDEQIATEVSNPFALHLGTTFYVLTPPALMDAQQSKAAEAITAKRAAEQFDREFQRYTTKQSVKSARAVALARAELAKYNALVFQDKKLEDAGIMKGRLSPEMRAIYEKKIKDIENALDTFHLSVAGYNRTKALLSFVLLVAFALMMFFQPWAKHFNDSDDLTYEEYEALEEESSETLKDNVGLSDEL
ncbi:hypothetical protein F443_07841 [Plasmopara halstedii]|uniref:Uncharacterized protein n=1 Tax=Plasmopara halstedii TaxID=4781 RepID=A0A0P1AVE8_PLAHL|nr:hypothetical protein F443_07841 [Plasmopara halstedii]CEG46170.1 hypothetical protein F443_07841 [Plasmopara halstedii]|eukprot:XP_024582539.1 hypothetical protein F443_07841 [Plasmopara halstedii]